MARLAREQGLCPSLDLSRAPADDALTLQSSVLEVRDRDAHLCEMARRPLPPVCHRERPLSYDFDAASNQSAAVVAGQRTSTRCGACVRPYGCHSAASPRDELVSVPISGGSGDELHVPAGWRVCLPLAIGAAVAGDHRESRPRASAGIGSAAGLERTHVPRRGWRVCRWPPAGMQTARAVEALTSRSYDRSGVRPSGRAAGASARAHRLFDGQSLRTTRSERLSRSAQDIASVRTNGAANEGPMAARRARW